jgi:isoleucyl-tRNA synthetase
MAKKALFFKPISSQVNFPEVEEEILRFWKEAKIFEKSVNKRPKNKPYSFYDGPPFITGLPHYGNLLGSIAKDLVPRYQTMKGYRVRRVWGWDCHGLPIEEKTEKKLGLANRRDIEKIGIKKFLKECRAYVSETSAEWNWYIDHVARWVDMDNAYKTMDFAYMESVIWAFKKLYDQGLVYQGLKTLLYCTRCGTPVSKFEIAMDDSYADVQDPAVTVEFPVTSPGKFQGARVLAWTTTPWTLPSNRALVVDENEDYLEFSGNEKGKTYIAAKKRIKSLMGEDKYKKIRQFKGRQLIGLTYQAPYRFFPPNQNDFKIYHYKGMVNMEEGVGIVHSAPGFGEIDTQMGRHHNLSLMFSVDDEGRFVKKVGDFKNIYVKDADPLIIADLEKRDLLFKKETITHRYPYCYRCKTPLIYKAVKAWFIAIQKIKKEMLALNKNINWVPAYFKEGRFKNTIKEAPDWCVSRTRYWATIMPIWRCQACQSLKVVGSAKEIEKSSVKKTKVTDLHRTGVDHIRFKCEKCGREMARIPEVLDCWFESASMPYGERHYPFENKVDFERAFPADYIAEYTGQLRAWFYYLHALSTALFKSGSFKNVVVTGVTLGTDGRKMSKSFGNYPDPRGVLGKYGGDALRLYLMASRLMAGNDINMTKGEEILDQVKTVLLPLWNSYKFFVLNANLFEFKPARESPTLKNILNQWIRLRLQEFINQVEQSLENYHLSEATRQIRPFVEDLSAWYIRRSRDAFREGSKEHLQTLYQTLSLFIRTVAPIIPFVTEAIYQDLNRQFCPRGFESVHLCDFPRPKKLGPQEKKLLSQMELVRQVCSLAHSIRKEKGIKVRQPLQNLSYSWSQRLPKALEELIADEVNVKKVVWKKKKTKSPQIRLVTILNKALIAEGRARDLIRQIQQRRKEQGFSLTALATVYAPDLPKDKKLLAYIKERTLAKKLIPAKKLSIKKGT